MRCVASQKQILAEHGILLGRGVPGHTTNWGGLTVRELLHAAHLLGCWPHVQELCLSFCGSNGLRVEWIRQLAERGPHHVTLANLLALKRGAAAVEGRRKKASQSAACTTPPHQGLLSTSAGKAASSGEASTRTSTTGSCGDSPSLPSEEGKSGSLPPLSQTPTEEPLLALREKQNARRRSRRVKTEGRPQSRGGVSARRNSVSSGSGSTPLSISPTETASFFCPIQTPGFKTEPIILATPLSDVQGAEKAEAVAEQTPSRTTNGLLPGGGLSVKTEDVPLLEEQPQQFPQTGKQQTRRFAPSSEGCEGLEAFEAFEAFDAPPQKTLFESPIATPPPSVSGSSRKSSSSRKRRKTSASSSASAPPSLQVVALSPSAEGTWTAPVEASSFSLNNNPPPLAASFGFSQNAAGDATAAPPTFFAQPTAEFEARAPLPLTFSTPREECSPSLAGALPVASFANCAVGAPAEEPPHGVVAASPVQVKAEFFAEKSCVEEGRESLVVNNSPTLGGGSGFALAGASSLVGDSLQPPLPCAFSRPPLAALAAESRDGERGEGERGGAAIAAAAAQQLLLDCGAEESSFDFCLDGSASSFGGPCGGTASSLGSVNSTSGFLNAFDSVLPSPGRSAGVCAPQQPPPSSWHSSFVRGVFTTARRTPCEVGGSSSAESRQAVREERSARSLVSVSGNFASPQSSSPLPEGSVQPVGAVSAAACSASFSFSSLPSGSSLQGGTAKESSSAVWTLSSAAAGAVGFGEEVKGSAETAPSHQGRALLGGFPRTLQHPQRAAARSKPRASSGGSSSKGGLEDAPSLHELLEASSSSSESFSEGESTGEEEDSSLRGEGLFVPRLLNYGVPQKLLRRKRLLPRREKEASLEGAPTSSFELSPSLPVQASASLFPLLLSDPSDALGSSASAASAPPPALPVSCLADSVFSCYPSLNKESTPALVSGTPRHSSQRPSVAQGFLPPVSASPPPVAAFEEGRSEWGSNFANNSRASACGTSASVLASTSPSPSDLCAAGIFDDSCSSASSRVALGKGEAAFSSRGLASAFQPSPPCDSESGVDVPQPHLLQEGLFCFASAKPPSSPAAAPSSESGSLLEDKFPLRAQQQQQQQPGVRSKRSSQSRRHRGEGNASRRRRVARVPSAPTTHALQQQPPLDLLNSQCAEQTSSTLSWGAPSISVVATGDASEVVSGVSPKPPSEGLLQSAFAETGNLGGQTVFVSSPGETTTHFATTERWGEAGGGASAGSASGACVLQLGFPSATGFASPLDPQFASAKGFSYSSPQGAPQGMLATNDSSSTPWEVSSDLLSGGAVQCSGVYGGFAFTPQALASPPLSSSSTFFESVGSGNVQTAAAAEVHLGKGFVSSGGLGSGSTSAISGSSVCATEEASCCSVCSASPCCCAPAVDAAPAWSVSSDV